MYILTDENGKIIARSDTAVDGYTEVGVFPEGFADYYVNGKIATSHDGLIPIAADNEIGLEWIYDVSGAKTKLIEQVKTIASDSILSAYPLYKQQNLDSDAEYATEVIVYEFTVAYNNLVANGETPSFSKKTSSDVKLEMNLLVLPYKNATKLKAFRETISSFDFSTYTTGLSGGQLTRCTKYYRQILEAMTARRLVLFVRTWSNDKEEAINACASESELSAVDITDCPVL